MKIALAAVTTLFLVGTASAGTAQQNYDNHLLVLKQMNACVAFYDRSLQSGRDNGKKVMSANLAVFRSKVDEYALVNNLISENRELRDAWLRQLRDAPENYQGYSLYSETHPTRKYCDNLANSVRAIPVEKENVDWIAEGKANTKKLIHKYRYNSVSLQCTEVDNFCHETNTCDIPYRISGNVKIDITNQEFFNSTHNVHAYAINRGYYPLSERHFFSDLDIKTVYNLPEISFWEIERDNGKAKIERRHIFAPRFKDPLNNKLTGEMHKGDVVYDYRITVHPAAGAQKMSYIRGACTLTGYNQ